jgi:hypothetical protein
VVEVSVKSDIGRRTPLWRWALWLAAAEALGMTAASAAAKAGQALVGEPSGVGEIALVLGLSTLAGLVEGAAVAVAASAALRPLVPDLPARRWARVTTLVAAAGWAGGSLPGALASSQGRGGTPPVLLLLAGAAGIGASMGAILGAAQALVLRQHVPHPWRWVAASTLAWPPAMIIIFAGASAPSSDWPAVPVVALGTLTGAVAGSVLGLLLGWSADSLSGTALSGRIVLAVLTSPLRQLLPTSLVGLGVRGRVTGTWHRFPVAAAPDGEALIVVPGRPQAKQWWRNLARPSQIEICSNGAWTAADAWILHRDDQAYATSLQAYRARYPRVHLPGSPLLVRIVPEDVRQSAMPGTETHHV